MGASGRVLSVFWVFFNALLWRSGCLLNVFFLLLLTFFDLFWAIFDLSGAIGGHVWAISGPKWDVGWFGPIWIIFGSIRGHFVVTLGSFWHRFGVFLGRFQTIFRSFQHILGHFFRPFCDFLLMFCEVDCKIKKNDARKGKNMQNFCQNSPKLWKIVKKKNKPPFRLETSCFA